MDNVTRHLPCKLTEDERTRHAKAMAEAYKRVEELEDDKQAAVATFNAEIKEAHKSVGALADKVRTGEEFRSVECLWIKDLSKMSVELVRQDTQEVVEARTMTAAEAHEARQEKLPLDGQAAARALGIVHLEAKVTAGGLNGETPHSEPLETMCEDDIDITPMAVDSQEVAPEAKPKKKRSKKAPAGHRNGVGVPGKS